MKQGDWCKTCVHSEELHLGLIQTKKRKAWWLWIPVTLTVMTILKSSHSKKQVHLSSVFIFCIHKFRVEIKLLLRFVLLYEMGEQCGHGDVGEALKDLLRRLCRGKEEMIWLPWRPSLLACPLHQQSPEAPEDKRTLRYTHWLDNNTGTTKQKWMFIVDLPQYFRGSHISKRYKKDQHSWSASVPRWLLGLLYNRNALGSTPALWPL